MVDKEIVAETKVSAEAVDVDKEARRIISEFLVPEFDKLRRLFCPLKTFQITVFIRSGSFITSPTTSTFPVPMCPTDNPSEFWSRVVALAEKSGMEAACFPPTISPYFFGFTMHYED